MARFARKTKTVICILVCCVLVLANLGTSRKVRAEALPDVLSGSSTIADIVLTYYSTVGAGISNIEWINTLNDSLGSNFGTIESFVDQGYLLQNDSGVWEPAQELVNAIENTSAYQSLGLDQIFNVSAQEAAAGGGLAASGAATLAASAGGVASIGGVALFAGVSAAYWAGIGAGTLIAHLTGLYGDNITANMPVTVFDADRFAKNKLNGFTGFTIQKLGNTSYYTMYTTDIGILYYYISSKQDNTNIAVGRVYNPSNNVANVRYVTDNNISNDNVSAKGYKNVFSNIGVNDFYNGFKVSHFPNFFETYNDSNVAVNKWKNGEDIPIYQNYSPDVIGPEGNQKGSYDSENQKYNVPDFKPQIDPGTEAGKVLSIQDWLNFANSVNNNNSNVNPLPDNAELFQNLIDALKIPLPSPGPSPDPDPDPDPTPNPTPVPDPDYGDPNPDQPDWEDPTEVPDPVDTGNPWRLPDLSKKFPFCIPWDIGAMFGKLKVNSRQAPHISWRFNPPNTPIDYTFDLDLEDYEEVATLLRSLELIAFIVGLAFATRYLIGAT